MAAWCNVNKTAITRHNDIMGVYVRTAGKGLWGGVITTNRVTEPGCATRSKGIKVNNVINCTGDVWISASAITSNDCIITSPRICALGGGREAHGDVIGADGAWCGRNDEFMTEDYIKNIKGANAPDDDAATGLEGNGETADDAGGDEGDGGRTCAVCGCGDDGNDISERSGVNGGLNMEVGTCDSTRTCGKWNMNCGGTHAKNDMSGKTGNVWCIRVGFWCRCAYCLRCVGNGRKRSFYGWTNLNADEPGIANETDETRMNRGVYVTKMAAVGNARDTTRGSGGTQWAITPGSCRTANVSNVWRPVSKTKSPIIS